VKKEKRGRGKIITLSLTDSSVMAATEEVKTTFLIETKEAAFKAVWVPLTAGSYSNKGEARELTKARKTLGKKNNKYSPQDLFGDH